MPADVDIDLVIFFLSDAKTMLLAIMHPHKRRSARQHSGRSRIREGNNDQISERNTVQPRRQFWPRASESDRRAQMPRLPHELYGRNPSAVGNPGAPRVYERSRDQRAPRKRQRYIERPDTPGPRDHLVNISGGYSSYRDPESHTRRRALRHDCRVLLQGSRQQGERLARESARGRSSQRRKTQAGGGGRRPDAESGYIGRPAVEQLEPEVIAGSYSASSSLSCPSATAKREEGRPSGAVYRFNIV